MNTALHAQTPMLDVIDSRGLTVRQVALHRTAAEVLPTQRVTRQYYDLAGRLEASWDPRLWLCVEHGQPIVPNLTSVYSLLGQPLLTESVDAGWRLGLLGEAGQTVAGWDTHGSQRQTEFDTLLRPIVIHEQARVVERFTYGGAESASTNQCHQLTRHDDTSGTRYFSDYGVSGAVLSETRHFLEDLASPDWPESPAERDVLLETSGLSSHWTFNALGEPLSQTDAMGNTRSFFHTVAGQLKETRLTLAGADIAETLVSDIRYNAFNQVESETAGNGVISTALYQAEDGVLIELRAALGNDPPLQHLKYEYDPVGNVVQIEEATQPVRYFANQKIEPINRYRYDTLYQLIEANGREVKTGASHGPALPDLQNLPPDPNQMANYTQTYDYDAAGNLLEMRHVGAQSFTRTMLVAEDSNRSLPDDDTGADFETGFDANGNLQQLVRGQAMSWDARNQLHQVTAVKRDDGPDDTETYIYDGGGQRCRKVRTAQTGSRTLTAEVRYLPGLEIRTNADGEILHVISVQAGRNSVRVLHWQANKPADIVNDQTRYSLSDHLGSSTLELDDKAGLISQESYYPYGGTAWWAGQSALEAKYKTIRYSGKERDATGLYYYGYRYYAPWLQRWVSPDPGGDVDGLNVYCMVANNPSRYRDSNGLGLIDALDLAGGIPDPVKVATAMLKQNLSLERRHSLFVVETDNFLKEAKENSLRISKMKQRTQLDFLKENPELPTNKKLSAYAAYSAAMSRDNSMIVSGFTNYRGSLSPIDLFPGVQLQIPRRVSVPALEQHRPDPGTFSARLKKSIPPRPENFGKYKIIDTEAFIDKVKNMYDTNSKGLHPIIETSIRAHIRNNKNTLPIKAGIAGLHAEVRALNEWLHENPEQDTNKLFDNTALFTKRLTAGAGKKSGDDFPACFNCSGILSNILHVMTGRIDSEEEHELRTSSAPPPRV